MNPFTAQVTARPCSAPSTGGWPWFPHACYVSYGTLSGHHKEHRLVRRGHSTTSCRGSFYLCPLPDSPMRTGAPVHVVARNNHAREGEGCDLEGHGASRACPAVCCAGMAGGIAVLHRGNLFLGGSSVPRAHPGRGVLGLQAVCWPKQCSTRSCLPPCSDKRIGLHPG